VTRANALLSKLAAGIVLKLKVSELKLSTMSSNTTAEAHRFTGNDIALAVIIAGIRSNIRRCF